LKQLFNDGHGNVPSEEEYQQRIYAKTASLFASATETGAILCQAPAPEVKALRDYGYYLGMAFQIVDDILDFRGDEEQMGKPVANDLRQGIATLPVMLYNQKFPGNSTILKAVRRERVSDEELLAVVDKIRASGSVEESLAEARRFIAQAQTALHSLPDNQYRRAMAGIADYTVTRDI
jgi:geranylgeranyl pyrophosphate synthase